MSRKKIEKESISPYKKSKKHLAAAAGLEYTSSCKRKTKTKRKQEERQGFDDEKLYDDNGGKIFCKESGCIRPCW